MISIRKMRIGQTWTTNYPSPDSPLRDSGLIGPVSVVYSVQTVYDDGKSTVASYVAGRTEGIHSDVEGNHERLSFRTEAQNASQWSQCRHHRSARHTGGCYHTDSQKHDEMQEEWQVVR